MSGYFAYSLHEGGCTVIRRICLLRSLAMNQGAQSTRISQPLGMAQSSQALLLLLVLEAAQSGEDGLIPVPRQDATQDHHWQGQPYTSPYPDHPSTLTLNWSQGC